MSTNTERFAALPDSYVFNADDGLMVADIAPHGKVSYSTSNGNLLRITAFGKNVRTAGDLRALLTENPRVRGENPWADNFGEALGASLNELIDHTVMAWLQGRVLRDLLFEKEIITRQEWAERLRQEYAFSFWAMRDGLIPLGDKGRENYKTVYADFLAREKERAALFPPIPDGGLIPDAPANRDLLFPQDSNKSAASTDREIRQS